MMYIFHLILLQGKCTDTNGSIFSKYEEPCFQFEIPEDTKNSSDESIHQYIASEKPISTTCSTYQGNGHPSTNCGKYAEPGIRVIYSLSNTSHQLLLSFR